MSKYNFFIKKLKYKFKLDLSVFWCALCHHPVHRYKMIKGRFDNETQVSGLEIRKL